MFSLQTMFGGKDRIFGLLEESSEAILEAAHAAYDLTHDDSDKPKPTLATFSAARKHERDLAAEISEELVNTFVTVLEREDVEAMNSELYKIPKKIENFAERYVLVADRLEGVNFGERTTLLLGCAEMLKKMILQLQKGVQLEPLRDLQRKLQALESEADELLLEPYRNLYVNASDPMRAMLAKDLFELLEKAIDRCRDVGNIIYSIALKNA